MKEEFSIEKERLHLIARLAEMELDQTVVRKLHTLLFGAPKKKMPVEPEPCVMSEDQVVEILRQWEANPTPGLAHSEFKQMAAQW